ncbi:MAG: PilT/PilU family type 4a pilus ATPase [Brockia lithotrophica]|nr:PilT/PilU family type 4a pilus ATPase [Brockia lithotrophica]
MRSFLDLFAEAVGRGATDLHVTAGEPAILRVYGRLERLASVVSAEDLESFLEEVAGERKLEGWRRGEEVDASFVAPGGGRFRLHFYRSLGRTSLAARRLQEEIPELESLGLPARVEEWLAYRDGLVLVTGPTGSGKSTTLAALVERMNRTERRHIVTLEDPVEYVFVEKRSVIHQREFGLDFTDFSKALRATLRQDPDVILVGEMRDLETIRTALTAAETGHLVLATLHTNDAAQTIDRIVDVFPPEQQRQIRVELAATLRSVLSQRLLPRAGGRGLVLVAELLVNTPAVKNLIRQGNTHQIPTLLETGRALGMQSFRQDIEEKLRAGLLDPEVAALYLP